MLAWDCKLSAAAGRGDYMTMARAKYQYLRLNPYRAEAYQDFASLLEGLSDSLTPAERAECASLAALALDRLEEVRAATSPLAYRIQERPDWDFYDAVVLRLQAIREGADR